MLVPIASLAVAVFFIASGIMTWIYLSFGGVFLACVVFVTIIAIGTFFVVPCFWAVQTLWVVLKTTKKSTHNDKIVHLEVGEIEGLLLEYVDAVKDNIDPLLFLEFIRGNAHEPDGGRRVFVKLTYMTEKLAKRVFENFANKLVDVKAPSCAPLFPQPSPTTSQSSF